MISYWLLHNPKSLKYHRNFFASSRLLITRKTLVKRKVPVRPANGMYRHLRMYARLFRQRKKIFRVGRAAMGSRRSEIVRWNFTGTDREPEAPRQRGRQRESLRRRVVAHGACAWCRPFRGKNAPWSSAAEHSPLRRPTPGLADFG